MYGKARQPIRDTDIAALLEPYEVRPTQLKIAGKNRRGYHLCDIEAALSRYAAFFYFLTGVRARATPEANNPAERVRGYAKAARRKTMVLEGSGQGSGKSRR